MDIASVTARLSELDARWSQWPVFRATPTNNLDGIVFTKDGQPFTGEAEFGGYTHDFFQGRWQWSANREAMTCCEAGNPCG